MSAPARTRDEGSWEVITAALDRTVGPGRPSGAWTKYCCPAHELGGGHKPSLGVKYDSQQQRTVVRCFAGCANEDVLESLGLEVRDMFDQRIERSVGAHRASRPRPRQVSRADRALDAAGLPLVQPRKPDLGAQTSAWKQVAAYAYVRADGTVAGEVVRQEADFESGRDKQFHQRRWNERTGRMEAGGFEPIPFNLPQVLEAVRDGRLIAICEGEKDAIAAGKAGLVATTNAGGAMVWKPEHAQWLKGARTVVIVADRDTAGYRRAERVMGTLAGLVQRVRVVQAATGKDLHDHLQCGHEISELEPIPHLDPYTRVQPAAPAPQAISTPAAETSVSAASSVRPATPGGNAMADHHLVPQLHDHAPDQTPDIDHMGAHWGRFMQMLLGQLMTYAQKAAIARKAAQEVLKERDEKERREAAAKEAAERAAVEAKLEKLRQAGWNTATRSQIVAALRDAAAWAPDSQRAQDALGELVSHIHNRWGLRLDLESGEVHVAVPVELSGALAAAETERAAASRLRTASARMAQVVASVEGLEESERQAIFAEIQSWRDNPSAQQLQQLDKALASRKVDEKTRTRIRFVAGYLGPDVTMPLDQLGIVAAVSPTAELRRLDEPLVDPGEEVKHRVDTMLLDFQVKLRNGHDTAAVQQRLGEAVALMTEEDREIARQRGIEVRANPGGEFKPLWPDHVDREALAESVRLYAALAPEAERQAVLSGDLDAAAVEQLRKQTGVHRARIDTALKKGLGLHDLERDQLRAVLDDVEAGVKIVPEMLFASDRFAAAVDASRAEDIAATTSQVHRRQLTEILTTGSVPPSTVQRTTDEVTKVFMAQTQLAAGHINLAEYEQRGIDVRLDASLARAGVPEPVRNSVRNHLDRAAGECAITGKQATRIASRWAERTDRVAATRTQAPPAYDSPQRREGLEQTLRGTDMSEDEIAQRMAADSGHAKPPSAAVRGNGRGKTRTTKQGAGVRRTHHRRNGKGPEHGLGL
ncbi:toprim domain-containing protein (plasmid) [Nocardia sp. CA-084685]|uniref:toprim domain-containing protein n=1 Tax=Nocardia sp. CA-084685 TaxID=3239970 RepID=UPI003D96999E